MNNTETRNLVANLQLVELLAHLALLVRLHDQIKVAVLIIGDGSVLE